MKPVRETIKKELATFRLALGLAEKRGKFRGNIKALMPEFKVRYVPKKRFLPEKEYKELLAALPEHRRKWVQLAVYTGARLSEVEGLQWSDVKGKHLHLRGTKTEKSDRFVPLHPALKKALGKAGKGPIVEHWPNVGRDLGAACKRIGIDHTTPNDLRRTYASWLLQAGVSNSVVANLLWPASTTFSHQRQLHLPNRLLI